MQEMAATTDSSLQFLLLPSLQFRATSPCRCFTFLPLSHFKEIMWDQNAQPKSKHFVLILLGMIKQYKTLCSSFKMGICNISLGTCQNEMSQHHWSVFPQFSSKTKFQQKIITQPNTYRPLLTKGSVPSLLLQLALGGTPFLNILCNQG